MDKELTYEDIYNGLKEGKRYVLRTTLKAQWGSFKNNTLRYFVPGTSSEIHMSGDGKYFAWTHFGSSANKATMKDLKFIIETIFKGETSDFTELSVDALLEVINNEWK